MSYRAQAWVMVSICSLLFAPSVLPQEASASSDAQQQAVLRLAKDIRKDIVTQPQYGVFDNIHFAIQGGDTVILRGQASRPVLKSSIENSVKRIEGVKSVQNEIEVLPASMNDDRLRAAVYASIYGFAPLQRYTSNRGGGSRMPSVARAAGGITNDPPIGWHAIHIIVKNGNVTLTGVVDSASDLAMAEMRANLVPGVFSVYNDLQVAGKGESGE
jgi:hyperosmotically inducible periplasmic protein